MEHSFELLKGLHLQQLWNKIFRRSIIEEFQIRFDETQSMGEDFEFVLDYLQAAQCKRYAIVNEALYYYVRANNSSLMSKFGLLDTGNEYKRLGKLVELSGANVPEVQKHYEESMRNTKLNYVYFIARTESKTRNEKIELIENVMQDGMAAAYYRKQRLILYKEQSINMLKVSRRFLQRFLGKIRRGRNARIIRKAKKLFRNGQVSIISQNCIGGVFYHDMEKKFLSPTINLFFKCPDFVKFALNLEYYMALELKMLWGGEYPIGVLDDIQIHFMHYQTCTEAKTAWERRKQRINWDNILVLSTDMEDFSAETFYSWKQISYPKILFSAKEWDDESCIAMLQYKKFGKVKDLIPKREFYKEDALIEIVNKCVSQ